MKKFIVIFFLLIIIFQFFQIIYSQRSIFTQNYDNTYWKDRFEHSQWVIPLSKRIIGDDGLYAYIGYGLVNGESITGFDSEVPPLGKYFIGLSIKIFNNPFYYALFFGAGSLIIFYLISVKVFGGRIIALLPVSVLFLDPLFFSQFWLSMLDISQLFFLLLNVLFIILLVDRKNLSKKSFYVLSLFAGISLGFFSQIKFPVLLPIIISIETIFFFKIKSKKEYIVFLIGFCIAFLASNIKFFLDGNSLIEFLRFQKYVLSFYTKSQLVAHNEAIWSTFFLGKFPAINSEKLIIVEEWWILWTISGILIIPTIVIDFFRKNSITWKGFGLFILFSFLTYSLLPIYPRYLILILPFIYLFLVRIFYNLLNTKIAYTIFVFVLLYGLFNARLFLQDNPDKALNGFYYNFSNQYFQDVYQENIDNADKAQMARDKFRLISQRALSNAGVKAIYLKEINRKISQREGKVKVKIVYLTQHLSKFSETKDLKFFKENGKWKIKWDWNLIFDGFSPEFIVQTETILGKRGSITNSNGKILAQDSEGYLISVNPEQIDLKKEPEMLDLISSIGDVKAPHLQNAYLENSLPGTYVPLASLFYPLDSETKTKLLSFPGVRITPYPSRIVNGINPLSLQNSLYDECCTRIYSKNYHGITGLEKKHDLLLSGNDGGSIVIKDIKGSIIRTVVKKEVKTGQDVIVEL